MFLLPGNAVNRSAPNNYGLIDWWKVLPGFLGGGGNTLRNIASTNHITLTNSPTWSGSRPVGQFGSISFDGSNDSMASASAPRVVPLTVCFWYFTPSSITGNPVVMAQGSDAFNSALWDWGIYHGSSTSLTCHFQSSSVNVTITAGVWTHFAFVLKDTATTKAKMYLNGVLTATSVNNAGTQLSTGLVRTLTGAQRAVSRYDDIILFSTAFTAERAMNQFTASRRGYQNELNWQRYPVYGTEQAAATFNPAWAINSNAYIHLGA